MIIKFMDFTNCIMTYLQKVCASSLWQSVNSTSSLLLLQLKLFPFFHYHMKAHFVSYNLSKHSSSTAQLHSCSLFCIYAKKQLVFLHLLNSKFTILSSKWVWDLTMSLSVDNVVVKHLKTTIDLINYFCLSYFLLSINC